MKKTLVCLCMTLWVMALAVNVYAQLDPFGNIRVGNEYIEIVVNGNTENMGRFAVDITGGNPVSKGDDNQPLIYGRPRPWTSFTTVRVDNENYIFGGKTTQRAGKSGKFGQVTVQPKIVSENGQNYITTVTQFDNQIEAEQVLSFAKSSTTGLYDSVQIKYRLTNQDKVEHKVGLRMVLDTMLGSNDGAPFRVGDKAITTDTTYTQGELPTFWQAFDSLSDPKVTAQGTIKGPDVTAPDKICYADWGSMADGLWDLKFKEGEEFWREGEYELDSAIALYWAPEVLKPGESITIITKYGLGGITIVPGILSLGVTSPAEVIFDTQTTSFPVVAYIENTSEIHAKDVVAQIQLPAGFEVTGKATQKKLGTLEPGSTGQVAWEVIPTKGSTLPTKMTYKVIVSASNTDSNSVERQVGFTPPPNLKVWMQYPQKLSISSNERITPNPFDLELHVKNTGGSSAYEVEAQVVLPPGLSPAPKEKERKSIGLLKPNEEYVIPWKISVSNVLFGALKFGTEIDSVNCPAVTAEGEVAIPELSGKVYIVPLDVKVTQGSYFGVQIRAANLQDMAKILVGLTYDTSMAKAMYISRGTLFVQNDQLLPWYEPLLDRNLGLITGIGGELTGSRDTGGVVAEVYFKALKAGNLPLSFAEVEFTNSSGNPMMLKVENTSIQIQP